MSNFETKFKKTESLLNRFEAKLIELKKACQHKKLTPVLVETLAYEYTPRYCCSLCKQWVSDRGVPNEEETIKLYKENCDLFIFDEGLTEEETEAKVRSFYIRNKLGFSLREAFE